MKSTTNHFWLGKSKHMNKNTRTEIELKFLQQQRKTYLRSLAFHSVLLSLNTPALTPSPLSSANSSIFYSCTLLLLNSNNFMLMPLLTHPRHLYGTLTLGLKLWAYRFLPRWMKIGTSWVLNSSFPCHHIWLVFLLIKERKCVPKVRVWPGSHGNAHRQIFSLSHITQANLSSGAG